MVDAKDIKPGAGGGKRGDSFRPWARKLRAFCNAKSTGMRAALEWAEEQAVEINGTGNMERDTGFKYGSEMDPVLHDFLIQMTSEGALMLVDTNELRGRGFETGRRL